MAKAYKKVKAEVKKKRSLVKKYYYKEFLTEF